MNENTRTDKRGIRADSNRVLENSGKSYSMMGYGSDKGIIPLTTEELFRRVEEKKVSDPEAEYQIEVSYIEIYNEKALWTVSLLVKTIQSC